MISLTIMPSAVVMTLRGDETLHSPIVNRLKSALISVYIISLTDVLNVVFMKPRGDN